MYFWLGSVDTEHI